MILKIKPQNISAVGTSEYIKNPNINAAKGSAPESKIEEVPESIYFRLKVEKIYGSANENVECSIKNSIVNVGLIETNSPIWLKSVKGVKAIEMKTTE